MIKLKKKGGGGDSNSLLQILTARKKPLLFIQAGSAIAKERIEVLGLQRDLCVARSKL